MKHAGCISSNSAEDSVNHDIRYLREAQHELKYAMNCEWESDLRAADNCAKQNSTVPMYRSLSSFVPRAFEFGSLPEIICTAITYSGKSTEVLQVSACIDIAHTLARTAFKGRSLPRLICTR
jgi:hypothetical protein